MMFHFFYAVYISQHKSLRYSAEQTMNAYKYNLRKNLLVDNGIINKKTQCIYIPTGCSIKFKILFLFKTGVYVK